MSLVDLHLLILFHFPVCQHFSSDLVGVASCLKEYTSHMTPTIKFFKLITLYFQSIHPFLMCKDVILFLFLRSSFFNNFSLYARILFPIVCCIVRILSFLSGCTGGLTENDFILAAKINGLNLHDLLRKKSTT